MLGRAIRWWKHNPRGYRWLYFKKDIRSCIKHFKHQLKFKILKQYIVFPINTEFMCSWHCRWCKFPIKKLPILEFPALRSFDDSEKLRLLHLKRLKENNIFFSCNDTIYGLAEDHWGITRKVRGYVKAFGSGRNSRQAWVTIKWKPAVDDKTIDYRKNYKGGVESVKWSDRSHTYWNIVNISEYLKGLRETGYDLNDPFRNADLEEKKYGKYKFAAISNNGQKVFFKKGWFR